MGKTNIVLAIKITKLAENDYYFEYPGENLSIYGNAESLGEAMALAKSSLEFTLYDLYEDGEAFPELSMEEYNQLDSGKKDNELFSLISVTLKEIFDKFGSEAVKKTISIPKYQEHYIELKGISLSKYVQSKIEKDLSLSN